MLAAAIHVEKIDEILPTLIEALDVPGDLFSPGEFAVVRVDLILHPLQVFHRFALARIKTLDLIFASLLAQFQQPLFLTAVNETTKSIVAALMSEGVSGQRRLVALYPEHKLRHRKGPPSPKGDGFRQSLFQVLQIDLQKLPGITLTNGESELPKNCIINSIVVVTLI
jgi:hypothetical protein